MFFISAGRRAMTAMAVLFLLVAVWFCPTLTAQTTPVVTSYAVKLDNPQWTNTQIWKIVRASNGDVIAWDGDSNGVYIFPADGTGMKVLLQGKNNIFGTGEWNTGGIAIDADDTLFIGCRWSGYYLKLPYDKEQKTWHPAINDSTKWGFNGAPTGWYSANDISFLADDSSWGGNGHYFLQDESNNQLFQFNGSTSKLIVGNLKIRPVLQDMDTVGNLYFQEDMSQGGVVGTFMIPPKTYGLSGAKRDGALESSWPVCGTAASMPTALDDSTPKKPKMLPCRVDNGLNEKMHGVAVDAAGNVYISTQQDFNPNGTDKMTGGVFKVPVENFKVTIGGTDYTIAMPNAAHQIMIAPIPPQGSVLIHPNGSMYVPLWASGWNNIYDITRVYLGSAAVAAAAVGQTGTTSSIMYSFNSNVTPDSFSFSQGAQSAVDFTQTADGTCAAGTAYTANQRCTVTVALTPQTVGATSAQLTMKSGGNVVASTYVHGVGQGPALAVQNPMAQTAIRSGLIAPKQVSTDRWGNFYVADAGNGNGGRVLRYAVGATDLSQPTEVGSGFTAPTGVTVDGSGNVFVADSGKVIVVPASGSQAVVQTGLGTNLSLGVDGSGDVFVADPDNHRVVKVPNADATLISGASVVTVGAGFTAPSAVTADDAGNIFVVDGSTLTQILATGGQTPITNQLISPVGIAMDASGAIYVAQANGTIRIPKIAGAFDYTAKTNIALDITAPAGVAVDPNGIVYITDGGTAGVLALGTGGAVDFGYVALGKSGVETVTMLNIGNMDLNFTSPIYVSTGTGEFGVATTGNACTSAPLGSGLSCNVDAALTPTGVAGARQEVGKIQSDAKNGDVSLTLAGIASNGADTVLTITTTPAQPVYPGNVTATVTVAPVSGTGTPTGKVVLYVDGQPTSPVSLQNGSAQFTLTKPNGGDHTLLGKYQGDMDYGATTGNLSITIGRAATTTVLAPPPSVPGVAGYYVLYQGGTNLQVKVTSAAGSPTGSVLFMEGTNQVGTGILDANGNTTLNTSVLALGAHTLTAVYAGDANFSRSNSTNLTLNIVNPSLALTVDDSTLKLTPGVAGSKAFNAIPLVGFTRTVQLACANLPRYSECTFDNPTIDFSQGKPVVVNVTISTNVPVNVNVASSNTNKPGRAIWWPASTLAIGLVGLVFGKKTKHSRGLIIICGLLIIASAMVGMTACSGNNYTKTPDAPHVTTPSGTQAVSITATESTTGTVVSLPFQLMVTVQ